MSFLFVLISASLRNDPTVKRYLMEKLANGDLQATGTDNCTFNGNQKGFFGVLGFLGFWVFGFLLVLASKKFIQPWEKMISPKFPMGLMELRIEWLSFGPKEWFVPFLILFLSFFLAFFLSLSFSFFFSCFLSFSFFLFFPLPL